MNGTVLSVKRFVHTILFLTFWILIFLNFPNLCYANHNHHDHYHERKESRSFKYSKEANEPHRDRTVNYDKDSDESWSVWTQALLSTLLISAAPFFILFFVPLDKSKEKESLLKILLSFASGGLLGDAFLHLIPHALTTSSHKTDEKVNHHMSHSESHDHEHGQEHGHDMGVGFFVLLGILIFLVVEKSVRLVNTGHVHSRTSVKNSKKETNEKGDYVVKKTETAQKDSKKGNSKKEKKKGVISASGYLNLAADFTHNLTDGLAIGASYLAGKNIGIITTVTILLHEVPHEIGDFAILIQSGCSRRKAMCLQLVTAVGAVMGTLISLMAEGVGDIASSWILPFTAGGFIYISTVSIIPELLEDSKFVQSIKEILAMLVGVLLMVVIADIE